MHSAHTRAPCSTLHDYHDPDRPRSKKVLENKKNVDNDIQFLWKI